ncbi:MAG: hypothetical protein KAG14_03035 [Mycoplasmataceae bacterium]|nr:hypothetical protein [Mycoplasmataceae bacterium]
MKEDFFMTNRLRFKELREEGYTLKNISELMHISYKTSKRLNKEMKNGTLIREHTLKGYLTKGICSFIQIGYKRRQSWCV